MAIIDRDATPFSNEELEQLTRLEPSDRTEPPAAATDWSLPARVLLASLAAAAGVIHLVMVPSHAAEWLPEGIAFAVAGWLQIGLAVLFLSRPSRTALRVSCVLNVVFVGAWVVSRIWGWPVGPEAGVPHAASFIDITCVVFEVLLVIVGYELLVKPNVGAELNHGLGVMLSVIPVGIVVLATAAIASPSAANHAHAGSGDVEVAAGGGHDHDHGGTPTTAGPTDQGPPTTVDDKGLSQIMNGSGEGGGHVHNISVVAIDASTQSQLDAQLAHTKPFIDKYPTVKDAEAGGYQRQGPFTPGLGAHYTNAANLTAGLGGLSGGMSDQSLDSPTLIYDGIAPDSKLAGFMYNVFSLDTQNPPEGFIGPNDHWHFHTNVCLKLRPGGGVDAPLGADTSAPKELCDKYGGFIVANTGYMVHVWTVPGYESPQGLFSNLNAKISCPNGTYYIVPQEEIGNRSNTCKDVPA